MLTGSGSGRSQPDGRDGRPVQPPAPIPFNARGRGQAPRRRLRRPGSHDPSYREKDRGVAAPMRLTRNKRENVVHNLTMEALRQSRDLYMPQTTIEELRDGPEYQEARRPVENALESGRIDDDTLERYSMQPR